MDPAIVDAVVEPIEEAMPDEQGEAEAAAPAQSTEESDQALIVKFEQAIRIPSWATPTYERMADERDYIAEGIYAPADSDGAVTTNWLLRNQQVRMANLMPKDPDWSVVPARSVGGGSPQQAGFCDTAGVLLEKLWTMGNGTPLTQGGLQDAMTNGLVWIKCVWSEDQSRDPLGNRIQSDRQEQVNKLHRLMTEWEAREFNEDDARYGELVALGDYFVQEATARMKALQPGDPRLARLQELSMAPMGQPLAPYLLPEVERWRGCVIDVYQPEHVRIDWSITAPEKWNQSRAVTFMNYMHPEEVAERWGLTTEERGRLGQDNTRGGSTLSGSGPTAPLTTGYEASDPAKAMPDDKVRAGQVLVYERWDRTLHRVFVWAQGLPRFLESYVPEVCWTGFFPCEPIYYNRVSGRFMPESYTRMERGLVDELNTLASDDLTARSAAFNRFIIGKGLMSEEEKRKLMNSRAHEVVEAENAMDIAKQLQVVVGSPYQPALANRDRARGDLEVVSGLPPQSTGQTGEADYAAEVEVAAGAMAAQFSRTQESLRRALTNIGKMMLEYAVIAGDPEWVASLCGAGSVWPAFDREMLAKSCNVEVQVGMRGEPDRLKVMQAYSALADFIMKMNSLSAVDPLVANKEAFVKEALQAFGIRTPMKDLVLPMSALAQQQAASGMVPPGAPQPGLPPGAQPPMPAPMPEPSAAPMPQPAPIGA